MAGKPNPPKEYARECTGRPSKFTPGRCAAIVDDIYHHVPYELAAEANGICLDTLYEWLKIGRNHAQDGIQSDYVVFSEAIKRAEVNRIKMHTKKIDDNVDRWQADAWLLERRWYKHFSSNTPVMEMHERIDKLEKEIGNENGKKRSQEDDKEV